MELKKEPPLRPVGPMLEWFIMLGDYGLPERSHLFDSNLSINESGESFHTRYGNNVSDENTSKPE